MLRIGIDVGGTFTDLVAVAETGEVTIAKAHSTPEDQSIGVLDGLDRLAAALGLDRAAMLARTERIVHGSTVATNALIERKGATCGLLATAGHRDVLEMREGLKSDRYDLRQPPPEPLVPRDRRLGVAERVRADGTTATPLDERSLAAAIQELKQAGVTSVAICYLHAWREPAHERRTEELVRAAMPEAYVSTSSTVLPQIKEYERVCTTVVNAYVGPALDRYLRRLAGRLGELGYRGPLLIIQSHGGLATVEDAVRIAAGSVLSGPAGGVAGSRYAAELIGHGDLIPFDMGGTSTDVSLIAGGSAAVAADRSIAGQRVGLQCLDIATLGAGGGSIARVTAGGVLQVGPESAGAAPGPACYGRGGEAATVTDANLVLGYLDPENFLGGQARLDIAAAEAAVDRIAATLGVDRMQAAEGIHRVINTRMAEGIRLVSVRRGVDPRRFAIFAFGGAGGLHVGAVARQLDLTRVFVPRVAAVLSAWGMLASDLRYEVQRTHLGDIGEIGADELRAIFRELEADGRKRLAAAAFDGPVEIHRSADMRYGEQLFEVRTDLDGLDWQRADLLDQLAAAFHARHEQLYTYALRDREPVMVNARVSIVGRLADPPVEKTLVAHAPPAPIGRRHIYLEGWHETDVHDLDRLAAGQTIAGPAIVESATTTVLLRAGDTAKVTPLGWLDIAVGG